MEWRAGGARAIFLHARGKPGVGGSVDQSFCFEDAFSQGWRGWLARFGRVPDAARFSAGSLDWEWSSGQWSAKVVRRPWRRMLMAAGGPSPSGGPWWGAVAALRARDLGWAALALSDERWMEAAVAPARHSRPGPCVLWADGDEPAFEAPGMLAAALSQRAYACAGLGRPGVGADGKAAYDLAARAKIGAMADAVARGSGPALCLLALSRIDASWEPELARLAAACADCPHGSRFILGLGMGLGWDARDPPSEPDLALGRPEWFDTAAFADMDFSAWKDSSAAVFADPSMQGCDPGWRTMLSPLIDSGEFAKAGQQAKLRHRWFDAACQRRILAPPTTPNVVTLGKVDATPPMPLTRLLSLVEGEAMRSMLADAAQPAARASRRL